MKLAAKPKETFRTKSLQKIAPSIYLQMAELIKMARAVFAIQCFQILAS